MTAFSRLQLAAALLEYDNDPDDPNPSRLAENSAIFSHIRTRNAPRARTLSGFDHLRETPNLLGVELPHDERGSVRGSIDAGRSLGGTRNSRGSIDVLRNPFGEDIPESERGAEDEEDEQEDLEVDLEAWGMTDYLGNKEKQGSKNRRSGPRVRQLSKTQSEMLPNPHTPVADEFGQLARPGHRQQGSRAMSMGGFGSGDPSIEGLLGGPVASEADFRRRSVGAPLDPAGRKTPDFDRPLSAVGINQPVSNRPPFRNIPNNTSSRAIPFPTSAVDPREEEEEEELNSFALPLTSPTSRFDPKAAAHTRTLSNASFGSRRILPEHNVSDGAGGIEETLFAPFNRPSHVDPKAPADARPASRASIEGQSILDVRERTTSIATMGTQGYLDDNPFSLPPPSPTRTSRFDPKAAAHARTMSNASFGSRLPLDGDRVSIASSQVLEQEPVHNRRYSRMALMRPKVLVMPSPLQGSEEVSAAPDVPAGFQLTTVGPPLPPGAKSAGRPASRLIPSMTGLQPSNSFTPNPRMTMSLSQLTFRNSLMLGGQRDVAYVDIEGGLQRAHEDGEQIYQEEDIEEEIAEEQKQAQGKAPGKLYGRSLMDELEARKEKMRSKQRVFTGDQRPSMMSRGQIRRSSTLIDLAAEDHSGPSKSPTERPLLTRRGSSGSKPLLDFSDEGPVSPGIGPGRMTNSKSVFGVDQLWERELAKLREIEAAEKAEEEERIRKENEKAAKKAKSKRKSKPALTPASSSENVPRPSAVSDLPPTLPAIEKATTRRIRPPINLEYSDTDSEASENEAKANAVRRGSETGGWGSSDDEDRRKAKPGLGSDSEDDVPLVRKLQLPSVRAPSPDSEDEKPLAQVLERKSVLPDFNFDSMLKAPAARIVGKDADEEDDTPLAVRHPRAQSMIARSVAEDDDDEKPLGLKQMQQQQQQAHYNLMTQQQIIMQAQLHSSMAFGAPSMMSGFSPFIMPPPALPPAFPPAPVADQAKFQSVDQWRHNVGAD